MQKLTTFFLLLLTLNISLWAEDIIELRQKDFEKGAYIITRPGTYRLMEDISFNANSPAAMKTDAYNSGFLTEDQYRSHGGLYDDKSFSLGFFAALVIIAENVVIDLNNHRIEQHKEHALLQRFFAVIELSSQPFVPGEGPHDFGGRLIPGRGVTIKNGTIGRSSHHGLHGNGNRNIRIENVHFEDFEIAAAALNGVYGLVIENCTARSRTDVPVLGIFSAARFLKSYLDFLVDSQSKTTLKIGNEAPMTAKEIRDRLQKGINAVHQDLIVDGKQKIDHHLHPDEYALFHNVDGVVDGNCFGFLVNFYGQAVEGFAIYEKVKPGLLAKNVHFKNVTVEYVEGKVIEVVGINVNGVSMTDPVGAVFQITNCYPNSKERITVTSQDDKVATYCGNMVANAQALIAKAHLNGEFKDSGLETVHLNIAQKVINWIEADPHSKQAKLAHLVPTQKDFVCNGDTMFHVNKGVVGFKFDATEGIVLENLVAKNIRNLSGEGTNMCGYYTFSHPYATEEGCGGPKTRAYLFAGCKDVKLSNCVANKVFARCGSAVGFDVLTDTSKVTFDNCIVDNIEAGLQFHINGGPNEDPLAIGFRISSDAREIVLNNICTKNLKGFAGQKSTLDDSYKAKVKYMKGCKPVK